MKKENSIEQNHIFEVGQNVSFERNSLVKSESTPIVSKVERKTENDKNQYIIENENGWEPSDLRKRIFVLQDGKKYLFVHEDELTLVQ